MRKFTAPMDRECSSCVARRASHIEPVNLVLRALFHCVRGLVRDESKLAECTRRWPCRWRARIFDPQIPPAVLGPFDNRDDAISAEIEYITQTWIREGLSD